MGTLSTALDSVRLRIKDQYKNEFTDEELIVLTTDIMYQVQEALRRMESNLTISGITMDIVEGVSTYPLTGIRNIVDQSVWILDKAYPLQLLIDPPQDLDDGVPRFFILNPNETITFIPLPDQDYTVKLMCQSDFVEPSLADLATYDFPWSGIWDRAIMRSLVLECLAILERSVGVAVAQAESAWNQAVIKTYDHGRIRRTSRGRLFDGV